MINKPKTDNSDSKVNSELGATNGANLDDSVDGMSDRGLKNCSMLVLENNIDNDPYEKSDAEHETSRRNTVD